MEEAKNKVIDSIIGDSRVPDEGRVREAISSVLFQSKLNDTKKSRRCDLLNALFLMAHRNYKAPDRAQDEFSSQTQTNDPLFSQGESRGSGVKPSSTPLESSENKTEPEVKFVRKTCSYYRKGICKHGQKGTGCESGDHPRQCGRFMKFGLVRFNEKGCKKDCTNFHPIVCRESLSTGMCSRQGCKMKHLKNTVEVRKTTVMSQPNPQPNSQTRPAGFLTKELTLPQTQEKQTYAQVASSSDAFLEAITKLVKRMDDQESFMEKMWSQMQMQSLAQGQQSSVLRRL